MRGLEHSRNGIPKDFRREPYHPPRALRSKAFRLWTAKPFNREERKDKRAKIAKKNYAPQILTTRSDVTEGFLRDLCEPWRVSAVKSFLPVDAKQFSRQEKPTRPTDNLPARRGARRGSSRAAWRRSSLWRRELETAWKGFVPPPLQVPTVVLPPVLEESVGLFRAPRESSRADDDRPRA